LILEQDDTADTTSAFSAANRWLSGRATDPNVKRILSFAGTGDWESSFGEPLTGGDLPPFPSTFGAPVPEWKIPPAPGMPEGPPQDVGTGRVPYQTFTPPPRAPTTAAQAMLAGRAQGAGAFPYDWGATVTGDSMGAPVTPAQKARQALEAQPRDVFQGFLSASPGIQNVSGLVRRSMENQYDPAYRSFQLQSGFGGSFRDFLRSGQTLNPTQAAARIAQIAGYGGLPVGIRTEGQQTLMDRFNNPEDLNSALNIALGAISGGVNPLFRGAFRRQGTDIFNRYREQNPTGSFLQYLGERGGNIFGVPGSSGNPFGAFAA
jgi:hypothetical protein